MSEEVRLQVVLARAGVASRRGAERMISDGRVTVNGDVVTKLGTKVDPETDAITVDGDPIGKRQDPVTVALYKPAEVVTTMADPQGRETVADILKEEPYRLVPVGRLDYHTEGLLLLSTDGQLAERLLHPKHAVPKIYVAKVAGRVRDKALERLSNGVKLDDGMTKPAVVNIVQEEEKRTWLEIVVTEGRNRLVRRMCEAVGHEVYRLVRTGIGTIGLGDMKAGQYRYLTAPEIGALHKAAGMSGARRFEPDDAGFILGKSRRGKGTFPTR